MTRFSLIGFVVGFFGLGLVLYLAVSSGARAGKLMADCVAEKTKVLGQFRTDEKSIYRLSVSLCSKYNRDGIVKVPLEDR